MYFFSCVVRSLILWSLRYVCIELFLYVCMRVLRYFGCSYVCRYLVRP